jgi:hypothetical protein
MAHDTALASLQSFGFSETEALVYAYLLRDSPATGYRISRGLGKAAANVYAAIESLANKGAVLLDDGANRQCRAVAPDVLFDLLQERFATDRKTAEKALNAIYEPDTDFRIYQLRDPAQVFAQARDLIAQAKQCLLLDLFPTPLERLRADIETARRRGVVVAARCYTPDAKLRGAICAVSRQSSAQLAKWPGQQLNMVVDARAHLLAMLDVGCSAVVQAVWSRSIYLSCIHHSGIAAEIFAAESSHGEIRDARLKQIRKLMLLNERPPGLAELESFARANLAADAA